MKLIHQNGERLFVTSLDISSHFGKQHKDVLRAIDNLECSHDFRQRNFAPTVNERPNPSGGKPITSPMYEITRDGFVFLCMGFTGKQAAVWKERYIEAFNQMENALRGNVPALRSELPLAREVGQLRDQIAVREETIKLKDQLIMGLQDRLIGSQYKQIRLVEQMARIEKRQHTREMILTIERMTLEGRSRDEIAQVTGKSLNCIRQHVWRARQAGRLPKMGEEA